MSTTDRSLVPARARRPLGALGLALLALAASGPARAQVGLWSVDHYDFRTHGYINTVQMCLTSDGRVTTNDLWTGTWVRRGWTVELRMTKGSGPSMEFALDTLTLVGEGTGTGQNQSWPVSDLSAGWWTTSQWRRAGPSC